LIQKIKVKIIRSFDFLPFLDHLLNELYQVTSKSRKKMRSFLDSDCSIFSVTITTMCHSVEAVTLLQLINTSEDKISSFKVVNS